MLLICFLVFSSRVEHTEANVEGLSSTANACYIWTFSSAYQRTSLRSSEILSIVLSLLLYFANLDSFQESMNNYFKCILSLGLGGLTKNGGN